MPTGYESGLVALQLAKGWGVFACDGNAVYSNKTFRLQPEDSPQTLTTRVIDTDLYCPFGGEFGTLMNTPVFIKLWEQVIADGDFRVYQWTVKVDADAAFLPQRLQRLLSGPELRYPDPQADFGVFINNCHYGLHGPIEVLTRRALDVYAEGSFACDTPPQEDVYIQGCLSKLGVRQVDEFDLLAEEHCDSRDWKQCTGPQIAFHPFKDIPEYSRCVGFAGCEVLQEGYRYPRDDFAVIETSSAGSCSAECTEDVGCNAWSWEISGDCHLKSLKTYYREPLFGFVAGLPRDRLLSVRLRNDHDCLQLESGVAVVEKCTDVFMKRDLQTFRFDAKMNRIETLDAACLTVGLTNGGKVMPMPCAAGRDEQYFDPQGSPGLIRIGNSDSRLCLSSIAQTHKPEAAACEGTAANQQWAVELVQEPSIQT